PSKFHPEDRSSTTGSDPEHYILDAVENPHLQHLQEKLLPYLFTAVWHAGKQLCIPVALSRAPFSCLMPENKIPSANVVTHLRTIITVNSISSEEDSSLHRAKRTLQDLGTAAHMDPSCTSLLPFGLSYLLPSFHTRQCEKAST
ncbi:hypothetical protein SK128_021350, partial [Halocaridina rubra]